MLYSTAYITSARKQDSQLEREQRTSTVDYAERNMTRSVEDMVHRAHFRTHNDEDWTENLLLEQDIPRHDVRDDADPDLPPLTINLAPPDDPSLGLPHELLEPVNRRRGDVAVRVRNHLAVGEELAENLEAAFDVGILVLGRDERVVTGGARLRAIHGWGERGK